MNWNTLNVYVGSSDESSERVSAMSGVNVTFVLMNEDTTIQYETTVVSDSTGHAILNNTSDVVYKKTILSEFGRNSEEAIMQYVNSSDADFNDITQWYVSYTSNRGTTNSQTYQLDQSQESGEVIDRGNASATSTKITTLVANVVTNGTGTSPVGGAEVYVFGINDSNAVKEKHSGTTTASNGVTFTFNSNSNVTKVKAHAYFRMNNFMYVYCDNGYTTSTSSTLEMTITATTTSQLNNVLNYISFHDLIKSNVKKSYEGVYPWTLKVVNPNGTVSKTISVSQSAITSPTTFTSYTKTVYFDAIPDSSISNKFFSSRTEINLFWYVNYSTEQKFYVTNKKLPAFRNVLTIENPVFLDTVETDLRTPVYNLPNVNFTYKLSYHNSLLATFTGSSNYSATTFNVSGITFTDGRDARFFFCALTEFNNSRKLLCYFDKQHYNSDNYRCYVSATDVNLITGEQLDETAFYYCKSNASALVHTPLKYRYITRETDYCMKGTVFSHYVQGYDYVYRGNVNPGTGSVTATPTGEIIYNTGMYLDDDLLGAPSPGYPGVSGFSIYGNKVITATKDFYSACCYNTNPKMTYASNDTTSEYKNNFVGETSQNGTISRPEYYTSYANSDTTHDVDNPGYKGHAYSNHNLCFLPNAGSDYDYLEFYLSGEKQFDESEGRFRLMKIGAPYEQPLEYSYWGANWQTYQWDGNTGETIQLVHGANVRFRNQTNVTRFSKDKNNYYNFEFLDPGICARKNISSLINVSANGLTVTGNYSFYRLFYHDIMTHGLHSIGKHNSSINDRLNLDPTQISIGCYEEMFFYNINLIYGNANLGALTGNSLCFYNMFFYCIRLKDGIDYIRLKSYPSGCCASMYEQCLSLQSPPVLSDTTGISTFNQMCFHNMFYSCTTMDFTGSYDLGKINDLTVKSNACESMFEMTKISSTPKFQPSTISYSGCYRMFAECKNLSTNKFKMTGGTVSNCGCQEMFYEDSSLTTDSELSATTLGLKSYCDMYRRCTSLNGYAAILPAETVPSSAYSYMYAEAGKIFNNGECSISLHEEMLSSTDIGNYAYSYMFYSAKVDKVPYLPATTLSEGCYSHMFHKAYLNGGNYGFSHAFSIDKKTRGSLGSTAGTEVVLNATVLPKKCYEYMFAESQISRVLYVITENLTNAGEESCSHMFESTKIEFEPFFRFMTLQGEESRVLTVKSFPDDYIPLINWSVLAWTFIYNKSPKDYFRNVMTDCFYDNTWQTIKILSGITVSNRDSSTEYFVLGYYLKSSARYSSQVDLYNHYVTTPTYSNYRDMTKLDSNDYYSYFRGSFADDTSSGNDNQTGDAYLAQMYRIIQSAHTKYITGTTDVNVVPSGFYNVTDYPGLNSPRTAGTTNETPPRYIWIQDGYIYHNSSLGWCETHLTNKTNNTWSTFKQVDWDLREFKKMPSDFYRKYSYNEELVGPGTDAPRGQSGTGAKHRKFKYEYVTKYFYVDLNATTLGKNCYQYMFSNCDGLYAGHHFRFGSLLNTSEGCFNHMFENCNNLRSIQPSITNLNLSKYCFDGMYSHCGDWTDVTQYKQGLEVCGNYQAKYSAATEGNDISFPENGMLHNPPEINLKKDNGYSSGYGIYLMTAWTERSAVTFNKTLYEGCFKNMFCCCNCVEYPKIELKQKTLTKGCYEGMFSGNVRMVSGITLDVNTAGTAPDSCFKNMFKDCPAYLGDMCSTLHVNVGPNCYDNMFSYCESMPSAPYLPATTLDSQSYNQMFFRAIANEFTATVKCTITGYSIVNGTGSTYTDELSLIYHNRRHESSFTIEDWSDYTPLVRPRQEIFPSYTGGTATTAGWITYYTHNGIGNNMEESDFTADVFTRFSEIMMNDSELGPFFVNTGLTVGYPSCLEFHTHLNHIKDVMYNFMNEYYGNGTKHRDLYDLTNSPVVINISNHSVTTTTGYSQTTTGVKYIKAALTSNQTGTSKTNQWVEGLEGFGSSGDFYKTNSGPSTNGPHAIPNGWRTHTFTP